MSDATVRVSAPAGPWLASLASTGLEWQAVPPATAASALHRVAAGAEGVVVLRGDAEAVRYALDAAGLDGVATPRRGSAVVAVALGLGGAAAAALLDGAHTGGCTAVAIAGGGPPPLEPARHGDLAAAAIGAHVVLAVDGSRAAWVGRPRGGEPLALPAPPSAGSVERTAVRGPALTPRSVAAVGVAVALASTAGAVVLAVRHPATTAVPGTVSRTPVQTASPERLPDVTRPPGRVGAAVAVDPAAGEVLLFGGTVRAATGVPTTYLDDTWTWTRNGGWVPHVVSGPSPRSGAAASFDPATRSVLLVGGSGGPAETADTWSWSGGRWTQLTPAHAPPACGGPMLAPDATGLLLLTTCARPSEESVVVITQTWRWDGRDWTLAGGGPSTPVAMAEDPATGLVTALSATPGPSRTVLTRWTWSGRAWTAHEELPDPGPSVAPSWLVADPATPGLVAVVGVYRGAPGTGPRPVELGWDGHVWRIETPPSASTGDDPPWTGAVAGGIVSTGPLLFGGPAAVDDLVRPYVVDDGRWVPLDVTVPVPTPRGVP